MGSYKDCSLFHYNLPAVQHIFATLQVDTKVSRVEFFIMSIQLLIFK